MRLSDFIEHHTEAILRGVERFGATLLPAAGHMDAVALRDHVPLILQAIVTDLRTAQTAQQERAKSEGRATQPADADDTAAALHAVIRARDGFSIQQLVAEYRALRASVLRLWTVKLEPDDAESIADMVRFNEAIDQAIAESVGHFQKEVGRWQHLFLGMLGHDLRSPLQTILVTAQAVNRQTYTPPMNGHADRLVRSARRIQSLLDDLVDYNRGSLELGIAIRREPTDLAAACAEELDLLRAGLPDHAIDLATAGDTSGPYDASRVRQAVANLVRNAASYGTADQPIDVRLDGDADGVTLTVANEGKTVPAAEFSSLFEPLRRGPDEGTDTARSAHLGLGLFIVQQIAKAHGGDVGVTSQDGRTAFAVRLPRA